MSAFYRIIRKIFYSLAILFTLTSVLYASTLGTAQSVSAPSFYFLVSDSTHIQASSEIIRLQGGAGYPLFKDQGVYAAYSVYFDETACQAAQERVTAQGEQTKIVEINSYGVVQGEKRNALNALFGCMQVLDGVISRLSGGATQESSKRVLRILERQFNYLGKEYTGGLENYAKTCLNAAQFLSEKISGIVYVSELRYLLCELSVKYADLSKNSYL